MARRHGERLDPAAAVHALSCLLAALGHLHAERLVRADVNPDNRVARPDGSVKLIDLGLASGWARTEACPAPTAPCAGRPRPCRPSR